MSDERADRGGTYRRRLARAAAASCALHMLFFGGLTVSRLELAVDTPESPEARAPKQPKRPAADFRLQVPRSASAEKPAHERPLELPVAPPVTQPAEPRERPTERTVAERPPQPAEERPIIDPRPTATEPTRASDTAATPAERQSPSRQAEVAPAETSATAEPADPAPMVADAAAAAPSPAAVASRERPASGRVAARWRPREVALLERLTARAPDATALAARDATAAAASSGSPVQNRQSTADARSVSEPRAESIAVPTAVEPAAKAAVNPATREVARRQTSRATTSGSRAGAAADTARDAPRVVVDSSAPPVTVAPATRRADAGGGSPASNTPRSSPVRRQTAVAIGGGSSQVEMPAAGAAVAAAAASGTAQIVPAAPRLASSGAGGHTGPRAAAVARGQQTGDDSGSTAEPAAVGSSLAGGDAIAAVGTLRGTGRAGGEATGSDGRTGQAREPLARAPGTGATAQVEVGTVAAVGPAAGGTAATGATSATGSVGEGGERLGPALLDRQRRGTAGRSVIAGAQAAADAGGHSEVGDQEGLSVSAAAIAALGAAGRARAGLPDRVAAPRSPDRIAAAALPTDGRVRDVAQAFAGRVPAAGQAAGGIEDPATLGRARKMVDRGLEFLARSQLADGRWRLTEFAGVTEADVPKLDSDTAATGLALLAFLGAGHDHFAGEYRDTVRRGLEFLISVQKLDGDLFLPADDLSNSCGWLYSHGIAAIALCEAVGMTGDPLVRPAAEKACGFIAASRHPTLGGWRYTPRSDADLSVSGWMLVALRAGDLGGVRTDPAALDGVRTLLAASATPGDPTRYAYNARKADQRRTDLSVACMTAVGTLMRLHTGVDADDPGIVAAGRVLAGVEPAYGTASQNRRDAYLWYYASQALVHTGGPDWQRWYASLVDTLEPEQRTADVLGGSWDATGPIPDRWGEYGGRVYVTALHLLALEVPWRHLPTSARAPGR
jgi:hypothetical protein